MEPVRRQSKTSAISSASSPYVNMSKDDVIKFSNTSFWNTMRIICICIFWLIWLAFLAAVIGMTMTTPRCKHPNPDWWQNGIFYQIYVRSFCDSDDDGVGDLKGIIEKLPLIKELGVTTVMLSSVFKSRNSNSQSANNYNNTFDYGYEVTNYTDIDDSLGDLQDFKYLVRNVSDAGLKLVLDFVPNHSGIDHQWFETFKKSENYSDGWNYYVSADRDPNQWKTLYEENAWTNISNKFYFNKHLTTQPDLNLRSSFVQKEFESSLRYWLDEGVDGFKIVATDHLFEDADFINESINERENFEQITRWRELIEGNKSNEDKKRIVITDSSNPKIYYGPPGCPCTGAHLPINNKLAKKKLSAETIHAELKDWFHQLQEHATSFWTTGDQDSSRILNLFGRNLTRAAQLLKFTLPGSALMYYGEEIDMDDDDDVENLKKDPVYVARKNKGSRYGYRNPMCWNNDTNCGFTGNKAKPWLKINVDTGIVNVQNQKTDKHSSWTFVQKLCRLKLEHQSLRYGRIHLGKRDKQLVTFVREYEGSDRLLVVINFSDSEVVSGKDLTKMVDSFSVATKATITLTTRSDVTSPYSEGEEVTLDSMHNLPPGYGFIASWKYRRTVKG